MVFHHHWQNSRERTIGAPQRKCRLCGALQTRERVPGYRWLPLVGRCPGPNARAVKAETPDASTAIPLPPGVNRDNGGVRCDMLIGPCACGATHDWGEVSLIFEGSGGRCVPAKSWEQLTGVSAENPDLEELM